MLTFKRFLYLRQKEMKKIYPSLSLVNSPVFLSIPSLFTSISSHLYFNSNSRLFLHLSLSFAYPHVSISIYLVCPPLSLSIFCLSKFTHISFNPLFLISVYPSYIYLNHFYILSILLYLYIFLSIQILDLSFQTC